MPGKGGLSSVPESSCLPKLRWTVLNIEHQPGNVRLVEALLSRRCDLRLLTAKNGIEGYEMARTLRPDTIIMNLRLPGINGFEALKFLRENPTTASIPVIAVSSDTFQRHNCEDLIAGFFRYLTIPYRLDDLMKAIDDSLQSAATGYIP
jgi:CheY-like chemotaxis protein